MGSVTNRFARLKNESLQFSIASFKEKSSPLSSSEFDSSNRESSLIPQSLPPIRERTRNIPPPQPKRITPPSSSQQPHPSQQQSKPHQSPPENTSTPSTFATTSAIKTTAETPPPHPDNASVSDSNSPKRSPPYASKMARHARYTKRPIVFTTETKMIRTSLILAAIFERFWGVSYSKIGLLAEWEAVLE